MAVGAPRPAIEKGDAAAGAAVRVPRRRDGAGKYRIILASREVAACNGRRAQFVVVVEVLVAERDPEHPLADKGAARK
jgi:hypothetical protein